MPFKHRQRCTHIFLLKLVVIFATADKKSNWFSSNCHLWCWCWSKVTWNLIWGHKYHRLYQPQYHVWHLKGPLAITKCYCNGSLMCNYAWLGHICYLEYIKSRTYNTPVLAPHTHGVGHYRKLQGVHAKSWMHESSYGQKIFQTCFYQMEGCKKGSKFSSHQTAELFSTLRQYLLVFWYGSSSKIWRLFWRFAVQWDFNWLQICWTYK